jgi:heptosyltransferase II
MLLRPASRVPEPDASPGTLIVGPAWVGDMVMAQSLFKIVKATRPEAPLDVLAPGWSLPLLVRMPEVREAIEMPAGHGELRIGARLHLGRRLRARGYGRAIVLPNSLKSAVTPWWARIPRRTGYLGEWRYGLLSHVRRLDKGRLPMTVQRYVALGLDEDAPLPAELPPPRLEVTAASVAGALDALGLCRPDRPLLGLCPGAEYGPAKRWPPAHFAELARRKLAAGWAVWIFGSERDRAAGAEIARLTDGACVDLSGRTSLGQAIDLLSLADAVVANDSGLMHVAAAVGVPLIAVYGSSDPGFTPPLSATARVLRLGLACSPCFQRKCPYGHYHCLEDLTPDAVESALDDLGDQTG